MSVKLNLPANIEGIPLYTLQAGEAFLFGGRLYLIPNESDEGERRIVVLLHHSGIPEQTTLEHSERVDPVSVEVTITMPGKTGETPAPKATPQDLGLSEAEKDLIDLGRTILAIRSYRNRTGLALKASKEKADEYRRTLLPSHPEYLAPSSNW
jgi:hypothetical protein